MIAAVACYRNEVSRRGLVIPAELHDELRQACLAPRTNERWLMARLQHGCRVMLRYEDAGEVVPDALWERFEAILVAWLCCKDEMDGGYQTGDNRKRTLERS